MNDLALPLTVPQAIRLHGIYTEQIARDRHKLDSLRIIRGRVTPEPDLSEEWLADNIRSDRLVLGRLEKIIYG
jgi:hypothetical protein